MQIHLDKKVPTGAGLGGGSSNAATALWAANQFAGCIASEKDLQEWSGEIGSDIPFFFSRGAAYCTGRGEVCFPWYVVIIYPHNCFTIHTSFILLTVGSLFFQIN